jgi:hypothetical protein
MSHHKKNEGFQSPQPQTTDNTPVSTDNQEVPQPAVVTPPITPAQKGKMYPPPPPTPEPAPVDQGNPPDDTQPPAKLDRM